MYGSNYNKLLQTRIQNSKLRLVIIHIFFLRKLKILLVSEDNKDKLNSLLTIDCCIQFLYGRKIFMKVSTKKNL